MKSCVVERGGKVRGRWRYEMKLPLNGSSGADLWRFIAAHVEEPPGEKACPLALKAWKLMPRGVKVSFKDRTARGLLPLVMPEESFDRQGRVDWKEKYVKVGLCGVGLDWVVHRRAKDGVVRIRRRICRNIMFVVDIGCLVGRVKRCLD